MNYVRIPGSTRYGACIQTHRAPKFEYEMFITPLAAGWQTASASRLCLMQQVLTSREDCWQDDILILSFMTLIVQIYEFIDVANHFFMTEMFTWTYPGSNYILFICVLLIYTLIWN